MGGIRGILLAWLDSVTWQALRQRPASLNVKRLYQVCRNDVWILAINIILNTHPPLKKITLVFLFSFKNTRLVWKLSLFLHQNHSLTYFIRKMRGWLTSGQESRAIHSKNAKRAVIPDLRTLEELSFHFVVPKTKREGKHNPGREKMAHVSRLYNFSVCQK